MDELVLLSVQDSSADSGTQSSISIDMTNQLDVGGFQFVLSDNPDLLSYLDITTTDRTAGFTVSAAEGEQGVTVVGFSLTGGTVSPGSGPIVNVSYNAGMVAFDTSVSVELSGIVISDPVGQAIDSESSNGVFEIIAPLTVPDTPTNVTASGGQNTVTVTWDQVWQAEFYRVWRDGSIIAEVTGMSYTETGLEDETEYCYLLQAVNSVGESDPSDEACAVTFPEYTGPPVLSLGSTSINAGDSFNLDVSLANPGNPVAGIQIQIQDAPDHLDVIDIVGTDRLDGFTLSWNPQGDGSALFVAFSLTGGTVEPGSGPIATIEYQSTTPYQASVALTMIESILSDSNGLPIEHDSVGGIVEVSGEEPPPEAPDAPTGLVASDGDSEVLVSWNASFGASEYLLYRENQGNGGGGDGGGGGGGGGAFLLVLMEVLNM